MTILPRLVARFYKYYTSAALSKRKSPARHSRVGLKAALTVSALEMGVFQFADDFGIAYILAIVEAILYIGKGKGAKPRYEEILYPINELRAWT